MSTEPSFEFHHDITNHDHENVYENEELPFSEMDQTPHFYRQQPIDDWPSDDSQHNYDYPLIVN